MIASSEAEPNTPHRARNVRHCSAFRARGLRMRFAMRKLAFAVLLLAGVAVAAPAHAQGFWFGAGPFGVGFGASAYAPAFWGGPVVTRTWRGPIVRRSWGGPFVASTFAYEPGFAPIYEPDYAIVPDYAFAPAYAYQPAFAFRTHRTFRTFEPRFRRTVVRAHRGRHLRTFAGVSTTRRTFAGPHFRSAAFRARASVPARSVRHTTIRVRHRTR